MRQAIGYAIDPRGDRRATCGAASRGRRPASCRRCRGRTTDDACAFDARSGTRAGAARRGRLSAIRTATARAAAPADAQDVDRRGATGCRRPCFSSSSRDVGIALELRSYEFATLMADVDARQRPALHAAVRRRRPIRTCCGASSTRRRCRRRLQPRALRESRVDRLIDAATAALDETERRRLYREAQRSSPPTRRTISLWTQDERRRRAADARPASRSRRSATSSFCRTSRAPRRTDDARVVSATRVE